MEELTLVVQKLNDLNFDTSIHKLYGTYFIGLGRGAISLRSIKQIYDVVPATTWMLGKYTALSEGELFLRTNISVS